MIEKLDFNCVNRFGYLTLLVMSFVGVEIRPLNLFGTQLKLATCVLRPIALGGIPNCLMGLRTQEMRCE